MSAIQTPFERFLQARTDRPLPALPPYESPSHSPPSSTHHRTNLRDADARPSTSNTSAHGEHDCGDIGADQGDRGLHGHGANSVRLNLAPPPNPDYGSRASEDGADIEDVTMSKKLPGVTVTAVDTDIHIKGWPEKPRRLKDRGWLEKSLSLGDLLMALGPLAFMGMYRLEVLPFFVTCSHYQHWASSPERCTTHPSLAVS